MSQFLPQTFTISALGSTPWVELFPPASQGFFGSGYLAPFIGVNLSSGASLTYTVQCTGDDVTAVGYNAANGNWFPFTGLIGQTAPNVATVGAAIRAVRCTVIAYTSGTATFQVNQSVN